MKKRILSGVQPTGNIHLGNYLGAVRNWVALQNAYDGFYCIVNLHAITFAQHPATLAAKTRELARIFVGAGVNPEVATIFVQSDVPEHAELTWVLTCIARMGELERMTQFKDKSKKQEKVGVGIFAYPVLMAADILLYQTDLVPVGEDQKQHLELTRDVAERFNRDYGITFRVPEPYIPEVGARIMSIADPTKKMSKSDENAAGSIGLLDDADLVARKFKRAVTDSGTEIRFDAARPAVNNLLTIYRLLTGQTPDEIEAHFAGKGYAQLKGDLTDATIAFLAPVQQRIKDVSDEQLDRILYAGAEKARNVAGTTLRDAYAALGLRGARY